MKNRLLALFVPLALASTLLASIQVDSGKYDSDGIKNSSDGVVTVTNGGANLSYINGGTAEAWEWRDTPIPGRYVKQPPNGGATAEFMQMTDAFGEPIPGWYTWRAWDAYGYPLDAGLLEPH